MLRDQFGAILRTLIRYREDRKLFFDAQLYFIAKESL